jgi:type I restriction-modification system DNA methylase subunit
MPTTNEWTFTSDIASQINLILQNRLDLPFSLARVEEPVKGSRKRHDLKIYDRSDKVILTGEVKRPENPDGRSPYQEGLVMDAHDKANRAGVEHFFTWNINKCVLWRTFEKGKPITERYEEELDAFTSPIRTSAELEHPRVKEQLNKFITRLLERCAALVTGAEPLKLFPLDDKFIRVWEAGLLPVATDTLHAINERYEADKHFKTQLNKWMRDEQGWTLSDEEDILRDNLERAAKFSCYVLANKIVFSKALRLRFPEMDELTIKKSVKTGAALKRVLDAYFTHAMEESNDYETVFKGDFGDTLPFLNDAAVDGWRELSEQTDAFDFTQINYEVIGQIFERLFSPEERHKFGQHYTRSEVVDLINAFCLRDANASVLDPACGGGTFLVRAYQRKKDLAKNKLPHQSLISGIYGFDISAYPVHLTTINLATRDLIEQANYPLVARKDFLRVNHGEKVFNVPTLDGEDETNGKANLVEMPLVDAVVGNPPYVRQEKINEYYGKNYKTFLQQGVAHDAPGTQLSGRSDVLCYFFTHGGAFLKAGGYMGLLTSSNWLDTSYGFGLQKYLLDNYEILAILESNCEPWFTGARVTTAATILRKQPDAAQRNENNVKFVWLKQPLATLLPYAQDEHERRLLFEHLRDRITNMTAEEETDAWRVRVVNQGELYKAGCLPIAISEAEEGDDAEDDAPDDEGTAQELPGVERGQATPAPDEYTGYKWGIFLRAPQIFFTLLERGGKRFVPLGQLANVKFGLKSGCDKFFFPFDVTSEAVSQEITEREFTERYGIKRRETNRLRIIRAGDGSVHLIEAKYLEPEIHGLMDVSSVGLSREQLDRSVVMIPTGFPKKDGYARKYIKWGEKERCDEGSTCQSRINDDRDWFDLTGRRRGEIIWSKLQQYRHVVAYNPESLICNCNLYDVFVSDSVDEKHLCAVLNSTVIVIMKFLFGSQMGREANQVTEIFDAKMMLVPDPRYATASVRRRLESALNSMRERHAMPMVDVDSTETSWTGELALADRQQLDDAVLELLGVSDKKERESLRAELYEEVTKLYRQLRVAEREMQRHRSANARQGRATAQSIAAEIWDSLDTHPDYRTPLDFIPPRARTETFDLPTEGRAHIIPRNMFQPDSVRIGNTLLELGDPLRCAFVKRLSQVGVSGSVRVPLQPEHCSNALNQYQAYTDETNAEFQRRAAAYTSEEPMQERIVRELWRKLRA